MHAYIYTHTHTSRLTERAKQALSGSLNNANTRRLRASTRLSRPPVLRLRPQYIAEYNNAQ